MMNMMNRREAERIYESGKDAVIEKLLEMETHRQVHEEKIAQRERQIVSLLKSSTGLHYRKRQFSRFR